MTSGDEITRVLVVDDDDRLRNTSQNLLLKAGFETDVAVDGFEGLDKLKGSDFDVVLLDFQMPEMDGIETLKRIKDFRPDSIVIMMTAYASRDNADEAIALNAYHYVSKPFDLSRVIQLINDAKAAKAAIAEAAVVGARLLDGEGPRVFDAQDPVRNTFFLVNEVNRGDPPVVILGETGTGRDRFAEVLHLNSVRKTKKLITFTCGARDPEELEARLFGREGAGGGRREVGAMEQSSGGTLLVKGLHEAEPSFAQRILESLRTGSFTRADSEKAQKINTRPIFILPPDAEGLLGGQGPLGEWAGAVGHQRVLLPPLRERREELGGILETLLERHAEAQGKSVDGFDEEALGHLVAYGWPGNLREADNVLDNALLRERGALITSASLPSNIVEADAPAAKEESYQEAMASFERRYFGELMKEHGGDLERAARHTDLSVEQLREKLKELEIEVPEA